MTPETLWERYSAIWSLNAEARGLELMACLADDASYCDPNGLIEGRAALSDYMGGFQRSIHGGRFRIRSVHHHHNRTLAHWVLLGPADAVVQAGTSFGALSDDGRLRAITGFFQLAGEGHPG